MATVTETILSDTYITTANPYIFTFETRIPSTVSGKFVSRAQESNVVEWAQQDLREPLLTRTCNHLVDLVQYTLTTCPRCLGQGTFRDIVINASGQITQIFGVEKLAQELEKIILTKLGDNKFHAEYGLVQMPDVKTKQLVTFIRDRIIENVYNVQQYQWLATKENPENNIITELINSIDNVVITEDSNEPSTVSYTVYVRTESARVTLLQGQINIS